MSQKIYYFALIWLLNAVNTESRFSNELNNVESGKMDTVSSNIEKRIEDKPKPNIYQARDQTDFHQQFYVITAIFNPASSLKRYELYHEFSKYMEESGVNLITIECIFPSLNQTEFQVTQANNSFHVQLTSASIYWVKENLINIAVSRLPSGAKWVAWMDADVYFQEKDWVKQTISALQKYSVVQLFKYAKFLDANSETLFIEYSFGYSFVNAKHIGFDNGEHFPNTGYGWATSVSTFEGIGGLPEYDIVGMGDSYFAHSLIDNMHYVLESAYDYKYRKTIIKESKQMFKKVTQFYKNEGVVGYVPLVLRHKWHGPRESRLYMERTRIIAVNNFNFYIHMKKADSRLSVFVGEEAKTIQNDIACLFQAGNNGFKNLGQLCENFKLIIDDYREEVKNGYSYGGQCRYFSSHQYYNDRNFMNYNVQQVNKLVVI